MSLLNLKTKKCLVIRVTVMSLMMEPASFVDVLYPLFLFPASISVGTADED